MKAYAIKDPAGWIIPYSIRNNKINSQNSCLHNHGEPDEWKQLYNLGYRCVRVKITEITNNKV